VKRWRTCVVRWSRQKFHAFFSFFQFIIFYLTGAQRIAWHQHSIKSTFWLQRVATLESSPSCQVKKPFACVNTQTQATLQTLINSVTKGAKGEKCPGRRITGGHRKKPNNLASTFFKTVHLFLEDVRFEHGGAKFVSCPGRHLTSVRPCR